MHAAHLQEEDAIGASPEALQLAHVPRSLLARLWRVHAFWQDHASSSSSGSTQPAAAEPQVLQGALLLVDLGGPGGEQQEGGLRLRQLAHVAARAPPGPGETLAHAVMQQWE